MGAFEFARPDALYGALLALPIVAFHLYRKRRLRLLVAFVPLLREASAPMRSHGGFARVSEWLRLLLRLLVLAALVLAQAGVRPAGEVARVPTDLVIVLDGDITQRTNEDDLEGTLIEERFDRSIALAKAHLRAETEGTTALVFAGTVPRTVVAPTSDREAAVTALDALEPAAGDADLAGAIAVAKAMASPERALRIVVVTARELPPGSDGVETATAGRASDDLGFVDQAVAALPDGIKTRARFVVRNFGSEARSAHVRFAWMVEGGAEAKALEERDVPIGPGAEADVVIDVSAPKGGGVLTAHVSPAVNARDAFAGNDDAAMVLTPVARPSVLVVHRGEPRPFVRALLTALGDAIDREGSGYVDVERLASATPRDLVVYDGTGPVAGAPRSAAIYLAPFPTDGSPPFQRGRTLTEPIVWRATAEHPLLRGVDLSTVYVATATAIRGEGVEGLAFVEGEAVLAEGGAPGARFVAMGLDAEGSDLPVRAALPVLLKNAIRRLSVLPVTPLPPFVRAGAPITARAPIGGPWSLEFEGMTGYLLSKRQYRRIKGPFRDVSPIPLGPTESVDGAPWSVASLSPETPGPAAPPGGPYVMTFRDPASHALRAGTRTVSVDLDRRRTIRPARPESPLPGPLPPRPEGDESRWGRLLLALAGALLVLDACLGVLGRRRDRRPAVRT